MGVLAGAGIGNSTNTSQTDINKYNELTSTTLSNESLINTVTNLISKTISQTIVSNNSKIQNMIKANNSINFVGGVNCPPMTGNINISNITQQINISDTVNNSIIINIVTDVTASVNNNVVNNIQNITKDSNTQTNAQKVGSSFGGIAGSIMNGINSAVNDVASVVNGSGDCAGFGNSCSTSNTNETDRSLQNKYGLDNNFSLSKVIEQNNQTTALVTQDDVTNILASITGSNQIGAVGLCPSFIDISNVSQVINITSLMNNSSIKNIANKVASSYINNLQNIINNMNEHKISNESNTSTGDIGDLGNAIAGVVNAGGNALSSTINAVGTASSALVGSTFNAGTKVITSGIGAVGNILGGLFLPVIIIAVIYVIYTFVIKPQMDKAKNSPENAENVDGGETNDATNITKDTVKDNASDDNAAAADNTANKYRSRQIGGYHGFLQNISDSINKYHNYY